MQALDVSRVALWTRAHMQAGMNNQISLCTRCELVALAASAESAAMPACTNHVMSRHEQSGLSQQQSFELGSQSHIKLVEQPSMPMGLIRSDSECWHVAANCTVSAWLKMPHRAFRTSAAAFRPLNYQLPGIVVQCCFSHTQCITRQFDVDTCKGC